MNAVQMMTGSGGWPMTMFLTPELKPFYSGTYFPPDNRYGRPGFPRVLRSVAEAYRERREAVTNQADEITQRLSQMSQVGDGGHELNTDLLDAAYRNYRSRFDARHGGFGNAPKFPPSMGLPFLLRYWQRTGNPDALEMAELTLEKMARGGMYDQLGGGFHRYSVDAVWLVPHFEKMLYDNSQLVIAYLEAFQATGKSFYRQIAVETLDYVLREMYNLRSGGFYSTQDADSEGVEGKFFVWMPDEVEALLGKERAAVFCEYYDITDFGNFEGQNILHVQTPSELFARKLRMDEQELEAILREGKQKLFDAREKRVKPGLDDKILTSWNGLMIKAAALGYQVLGDRRYLEAAENSANFLLSRLSQKNGLLFRTHRAGVSHLNAYLEDYSYFTAGLIALYEANFNFKWLKEAERLMQIMVEQFWDDANDGFFFTGKSHEQLIVQSKAAYDGATPSGTSMAIHGLSRLAKHLNRPELHEKAIKTLRLYYHQIESAPAGSGQLLCELEFLLSVGKEIAVVGEPEREDTTSVLSVIHNRFLPNKIIALLDPEAESVRNLPLLQGKKQIDNRATVYVCENYACQTPTTDLQVLERLLL